MNGPGPVAMADISIARAPTHVAGRPWAEAALGALADPDAAMRRLWLGVLDHEANDAATEVFRRALADRCPTCGARPSTG